MGRRYELQFVKLTDQELDRQLSEFEATYKMTSQQFLERYNSGELGDDLQFIRWSGLLRTAAKLRMSLPEHLRA